MQSCNANVLALPVAVFQQSHTADGATGLSVVASAAAVSEFNVLRESGSGRKRRRGRHACEEHDFNFSTAHTKTTLQDEDRYSNSEQRAAQIFRLRE